MIRWSDDPEGRPADRILVLVGYLLTLGYANHMAGMLPIVAVGVAVGVTVGVAVDWASADKGDASVASRSETGACHASAETIAVRLPNLPRVMWRRSGGAATPTTTAAAAQARRAWARRKTCLRRGRCLLGRGDVRVGIDRARHELVGRRDLQTQEPHPPLE